MVGVRDQGDDEVDLLERLVEGGRIVHVEGDGLGVLESFGELLCALERSAGCVWNPPWRLIIVHRPYILIPNFPPSPRRQTGTLTKLDGYIPTVTSTSAFDRTSTVGLATANRVNREQVNSAVYTAIIFFNAGQ